jgi:hypothetical protein
MLSIGVHHDNGLSPGSQKSGQDSRLMTEVSREANTPKTELRLQVLDNSPSSVGATVIDGYDFVSPSTEGSHHTGNENG